MTTKRPAMKPFDPKPFALGSTVTIQSTGKTYHVQTPGPLPASVWAVDDSGAWFALKLPTPSRPAYQLDPDTYRRETHRLRVAERIRHGVVFYHEFRRLPAAATGTSMTVHVSADCPDADGEPVIDWPRPHSVAADYLFHDHEHFRRVALCRCITYAALFPADETPLMPAA